MSTASRGWIRLKDGKGAECPICGKGEPCLIAQDGAAVICFRVEDGCARRRDGTPITAKDSMGWLHRLNDRGRREIAKKVGSLKVTAATPRVHRAELINIIRQYQTAVNPKRLERYADGLGVSTRALLEYGIGYDHDRDCFAFPMYDGKRKPVGVRFRYDNGTKLTLKGSSNGLFIPNHYEAAAIPDCISDDPHPLLLMLPEGPTDCAAAFDLGFRAVGRPSNNGGSDMMKELLADGDKQEVVIVADRDETKYTLDGVPFWPGIEGALSLAEKIMPVCGVLKFMLPPEDAKDLRKWVKDGGIRGMFDQVMVKASVVTPDWLRKAKMRVEDKKKTERKIAG